MFSHSTGSNFSAKFLYLRKTQCDFFFLSVALIYSNALDQIYYPLVDQLNTDALSTFHEQFIERSQIEELQRLLYYKLHGEIQIKVFVDMLCQEVELFVGRMNKKLQFLETEVRRLSSCSFTTT